MPGLRAGAGSPAANNLSPLPNGVEGHRGGKIIALAVISLLLFPLAGTVLSCANYMGGVTFPAALPYLATGLGVLVLGQVSGIVGVVFAYRDWLGVRTGRLDRSGLGRIVVGGVMAGVSVLLYWWMIGAVILSLF